MALTPLLTSATAETVRPIPTNNPSHECRSPVPESDRQKPYFPTVVQFTIAVDGSVKDVSVLRSSYVPGVDEAAIRCVLAWRYAPEMIDGVPTEFSGWTTQVQWVNPN